MPTSHAPTHAPVAVPTTPLPKSDQNLVWLDCEMTGLDPETDRIIEIAVIVTGPKLENRTEGPVLVLEYVDGPSLRTALRQAWRNRLLLNG